MSLLSRLLPAPSRTGHRLADPRTGVPLQVLVVADVDLDTATVQPQPQLTPFASPPQGVYAVCWFHGVPLGEVTVLGDPDDALPRLVAAGEQQLERARVLHLLDDALATPGGVRGASIEGLRTLSHPPDQTWERPTVTVAICTRDRPESLRACLQSVLALHEPPLEILVVDNASRDGATADVVREFPSVTYVHEPRQGLNWARNRALLEASGDIVAFADDDVLVHRRWAGALGRAFAEEPAAACVTGLVVPAELATPAQVMFEVAGGFGRGYRRRWFGAAVDQGAVAAERFGAPGQAGTGANLALRRAAALALGGFDVALDVGTPSGGGGDLEMLFRVVASGHQVVYEPSAVVRHRHRADWADLHRQMRGNGTGSVAYMMGAGRNYDRRQRRAFRGLARTKVRWYARQWARGKAAPDLLAPSLRAAERRGAFDSLRHDYYAAAARFAAQQAAEHGEGALHCVYPQQRTGEARGPVPVVDVDVLAEPVVRPLPDTTGHPQVVVRVARGTAVQDAFLLTTDAAPVSPARLRSALVDRLGTALLAQPLPRTARQPAP